MGSLGRGGGYRRGKFLFSPSLVVGFVVGEDIPLDVVFISALVTVGREYTCTLFY